MPEGLARPRRRTLRVLVVEDEEDTRLVMVMTLQLAGHEVSWVGNGYDALIELTRRDFDLMLLDIVMPGMTGLELLDRAREGSVALPHVMLVSAVADLEVFRSAAARGANAFVVKPFLPSELIDKVDELAVGAPTG